MLENEGQLFSILRLCIGGDIGDIGAFNVDLSSFPSKSLALEGIYTLKVLSAC